MTVFQIQEVKTKADWKTFIDLPWTIYHRDENWVPPLKIAVRDLLDVKKNPFFKHAEMYPLLCFQGKKCVGRVIGVVDEHHNRFHEEKTAFFGFFEAINDQQVTHLLLDEVAKWAKSKGMLSVSGPMNPSTNYECGLLVEGFSDPPAVMMTYNPPYYVQLIEKWGMEKSKDLFAYILSPKKPMSDRLLRHAERIRKKESIVFRSINLRDFDREVDRVLKIYNDAWEKNWGFIPMEAEEFKHLAKDMKMIIDPNLCLVAEVRGEPAGFSLTLPDVNQVFKKVQDGKLFPSGLIKILWNLKGWGRKKTIDRCRVITLGIKREYRELGLGALFYVESHRRAGEGGYRAGEASWILEDNKPMNKALEQMCGERYKTYRIYQKSLV
jgi:hypothetical protein